MFRTVPSVHEPSTEMEDHWFEGSSQSHLGAFKSGSWENLAAGKWTSRSATEMCDWDRRLSTGMGCEGLRRAEKSPGLREPTKKHVKADQM